MNRMSYTDIKDDDAADAARAADELAEADAIDANDAEIAAEDAALLAVHRFDDTREAYDATQCRDDIRDGDVLVVEAEKVVGFLDAAWPVAITEAHGEFHGLKIPAREHHDGRFTASAEIAERIAAELGFPLAAQSAPTA
nr:hypothetical protein OG781_42295 [Streptomyces sp. NBC_00830]